MVNIPFIIGCGKILGSIKTEWVGFCQYRKFFIKKNMSSSNISFEKLKEIIIVDLDENIKKYDCVLGNKLFLIINFQK